MLCQHLHQTHLQEVGLTQNMADHVNGTAFRWDSRASQLHGHGLWLVCEMTLTMGKLFLWMDKRYAHMQQSLSSLGGSPTNKLILIWQDICQGVVFVWETSKLHLFYVHKSHKCTMICPRSRSVPIVGRHLILTYVCVSPFFGFTLFMTNIFWGYTCVGQGFRAFMQDER